MHYHNIEHKFYEFQEDKIFYLLLTGLSYREIAAKYYCFQLNKLIYRIRKLMKTFNIQNRRQLVYFAIKNHLVTKERFLEYI